MTLLKVQELEEGQYQLEETISSAAVQRNDAPGSLAAKAKESQGDREGAAKAGEPGEYCDESKESRESVQGGPRDARPRPERIGATECHIEQGPKPSTEERPGEERC